MKVLPRLHATLLIITILVFPWSNFSFGQVTPIPGGFLTMSLQEVLNSDFFTFFRLVENWREKDSANRTVIVFKPSGDTFRKLVTLRITLDSKNQLVQIELSLARSFIDDNDKRVYANDIATNMIISSTPRRDLSEIKDLINEIRHRPVSNIQVIHLHKPPDIELADKESLGFLTYVGKDKIYVQQFPENILNMENFHQNGEDWLRIQFSKKE